MGKVTIYVLAISFIMLLYYFMGFLPEETTTTKLMSILVAPEKIKRFDFWTTFKGALTGVLASAGVIGLSRLLRNPDLAIMAAPTLFLTTILFDIFMAMTALRNAINFDAVTFLLFSPVLVLMVLTAIDWFRRHD